MTQTTTTGAQAEYTVLAEPIRAPVPCGCGCCNLPAAHIVLSGGALVLEIASRHHGQQHVTRVSLGDLAALACEHIDADT